MWILIKIQMKNKNHFFCIVISQTIQIVIEYICIWKIVNSKWLFYIWTLMNKIQLHHAQTNIEINLWKNWLFKWTMKKFHFCSICHIFKTSINIHNNSMISWTTNCKIVRYFCTISTILHSFCTNLFIDRNVWIKHEIFDHKHYFNTI